jgi:hypothetical protein
MSTPKYIKCPCHLCGGVIEFPAQGIGQAVNCPHCQAKTTLFAPPENPPMMESESGPGPEPVPARSESSSSEPANAEVPTESEGEEVAEEAGGSRRALWVLGLLLLAAGATAYVVIGKPFKKFSFSSKEPPAAGASGVSSQALAVPGPAAAAPPEPSAPSLPPKSSDDLKVGAVTLEKAKGSSLVYAVGTLRNESPHQRFGVKLELELSAADGRKLGLAKDYRSVLEPRQEWHFRALVLDAKTVRATVASIREEE